MSRSGRERHRDRGEVRREITDAEPEAANRVFRMTDDERQQIAAALRLIDDARRALQDQQNALNREIIRELRASADDIYTILNELEEVDAESP